MQRPLSMEKYRNVLDTIIYVFKGTLLKCVLRVKVLITKCITISDWLQNKRVFEPHCDWLHDWISDFHCNSTAIPLHGGCIACVASIHVEKLFCILAACKLGLCLNCSGSRTLTKQWRGKRGNSCPQTSQFWKTPASFHSWVHLLIDNFVTTLKSKYCYMYLHTHLEGNKSNVQIKTSFSCGLTLTVH